MSTPAQTGVHVTKRQVDDQPVFELRLGPLHVTVQRVPVWFVTLMTTATGAGAAWWTSR
jgi:hypothetical protein